MHKNIPIVVGIIALFLGLAIQPSVAVQPDITESDKDCNLCAKKVSKSHLILIEILLNRLERYDNLFSVLSKRNPIIELKYKEISENIGILKEMTDNINWDFPVFCEIMETLFWFTFNYIILPIVNIAFFLENFYGLFVLWVYITAIPFLTSYFFTAFCVVFLSGTCTEIPQEYPFYKVLNYEI
jgi:hypothetical protein